MEWLKISFVAGASIALGVFACGEPDDQTATFSANVGSGGGSSGSPAPCTPLNQVRFERCELGCLQDDYSDACEPNVGSGAGSAIPIFSDPNESCCEAEAAKERCLDDCAEQFNYCWKRTDNCEAVNEYCSFRNKFGVDWGDCTFDGEHDCEPNECQAVQGGDGLCALEICVDGHWEFGNVQGEPSEDHPCNRDDGPNSWEEIWRSTPQFGCVRRNPVIISDR